MEAHIGKARKYLYDRGIDPEQDCEKFGIELTKAKIALDKMGYNPQYDNPADEAVLFHHQSIVGSKDDHVSARMLYAPKKVSAFVGPHADVKDERLKALVMKGMPTQPYYAPCIDWMAIPSGSRIYLCESIIKAIKLIKAGYYAIGINGMWGFTAWNKHQLKIVPELLALHWQQQNLKLIYFADSNESKPDLEGAKFMLSSYLCEMLNGYDCVWHLPLEQPPEKWDGDGEHWGIDDAIVHYGEQWLHDYLGTEERYSFLESSGAQTLVRELNEEYTYVTDIDRVAHKERPKVMVRVGAFANAIAHRKVLMLVPGRKVPVEVKPEKVWLEDKECHKVDSAMYYPGLERTYTWQALTYHNLFEGWEVNEGAKFSRDWRKIMRWFIKAFPNKNERHWLIKRLAWVFQHPDQRLFTVPIIIGEQGTGKGTIFDKLLSRLCGVGNYATVEPEQYVAKFRPFMSNVFIVIDENEQTGSGGDAKAAAAKMDQTLKRDTGSDWVSLERKNKDIVSVLNFTNPIIISNALDGLRGGANQRRYAFLECVHELDGVGGMRDDKRYREGLHRAIESSEVQNALLRGLLGIDLSGWDQYAWAIHTELEDKVQSYGRSGWEEVVAESVEEPDVMWPGCKDVVAVTIKEFDFRACEIANQLDKGEMVPAKFKKECALLRGQCGINSVLPKVKGDNKAHMFKSVASPKQKAVHLLIRPLPVGVQTLAETKGFVQQNRKEYPSTTLEKPKAKY